MEFKRAHIGSLSHLMSELIRTKFVFDGKIVQSMTPESERLWRILDKSEMSEGKCKFLFSLFYNDKLAELEAELLKMEKEL